MAKANQKGTLHPIIMIDYIPRNVGHIAICGMVISVLYTSGVGHWYLYLLALLEGFVWPHIALFFSIHSKNPKKLEENFLLLDALFCGLWIAYLYFPLLPSVTMVTCIIMSQLSIRGTSLAVKGLLSLLAGCFIVAIFHGLHFVPETTFVPSAISVAVLFIFCCTMGFLTYARAAELKQTKQKLRVAYLEVETLNKVLKSASSSLELNTIMQQIHDSFSVFFQFEFITLQIVDERTNELHFRIVSGMKTARDKEDLYHLHPKLNYENCLSVKAYAQGEAVYVPDVSTIAALSFIDKNIYEIIGFTSLLYIPLTIQDEKIGVIGFYGKKKMLITEKILNTLKLQLSNIALILRNAVLYEDAKQKHL